MSEVKLNNNSNDDMTNIHMTLNKKGYNAKISFKENPEMTTFHILKDEYIYVSIGSHICFKKEYKYKFKSLPKYWKFADDYNMYATPYELNNRTNFEDIKIRKATPDEISKFGKSNQYFFVKKLSDGDRIIAKIKEFQKAYMSSLKKWADSLPDNNSDNKTLNEAASGSSNAAKRKEITDFIVNMYNALEKGGTKNSTKFLESTKNMSDTQFIAFMTSIVNDPKKHLYFEIEAFENEPDYQTVERVANEIVGEEYTHLYDYIAFPHLSNDPKKPVYTVHKVFNGYINLRRVQQLVNNKNHIPTSNSRRDPKTNQVVFESKAARIADVEQFAMICHGTKNVLKEFFGPRGGDPVMRDEMNHQIATTGTSQLNDMHDSKLNKTSLNTANVYLTAAGLESDLVTKNGILPRTIMNQYKEARTLNRDNVR